MNSLFVCRFLYSWLNFEKVVEVLVAEKTYYLQLEQLQTIIQKVCFIDNENEIKTMLDFYHDRGKIVKHRSMVVLRTQWLIDLLRQLISIPTFNTMVRNRAFNCMHHSESVLFGSFWSKFEPV